MRNAVTVTQLNKYIKSLVSNDPVLNDVLVTGEISNFKLHYSGHMYFTLKDEGSIVKCVMFKAGSSDISFMPENGMKIIASGYISVFERDGQYQLYIRKMQPDGIGSLHIAFEQLKKKLKTEGLFDRPKKKLPLLPERICIITSKTGSVIRDIINVSRRRFPDIRLIVYPVAVQGEGAAAQIARAIENANAKKLADVLIIARGGGSLEELWPFNEEVVARSIFCSVIPVVSAVGHETDFTISDFVADMRAPTPSAAAELCVPDKSLMIQKNVINERRLKEALLRNLKIKRTRLEGIRYSSVFRQPYNRVYQERMKLDIITKNISRYAKSQFTSEQTRYVHCLERLQSLNPVNTLLRGYASVRRIADNRSLRSITEIRKDELIEITLYDGSAQCIVNKVNGGMK